jgi:hypothetical protein
VKKLFFSMVLIFFHHTSALLHEQHMVELAGESSQLGYFKSDDDDYLDPATIETPFLRVVPMKIEAFSGDGHQKLRQAFEVLERVVNSDAFKERVINFRNSKGERAFASNLGLSNEEIYLKFMEGRETLQDNTPGEMNFFLKQYNRPWSKVIGYTSGNTNVISINYKYFKNFRPHEVAANLAHEWTHKLGLDHRSASEHDSVPYAIGYIVGQLGSQALK